MRRPFGIIACILFLTGIPPARAGESLTAPRTQLEKESYSIGYQFGLSIRSDEITIDFDHLVQGLHEAIDGTTPQLKIDDMRILIADLRKRARETALRKLQETTVRNAEESRRFLEENRNKEGVRTTESGLQYKVLKEGSGPSPGIRNSVVVNYRGTFIDGTEFDSSHTKGEPQTVQTDGVIKGWTEALQMMRAGATWRIFVPPDLAYGRTGLGRKIPPNKVLVFEIELLSVENRK